ncbi:non-ribosomal peptide synthetase [Lasiosphaeria hispida]|uniref:Non-ribosomal peptide synthetase n=1 Tax=Lasiosphaeria hispida TaxID=260671 RepID=A0AAJ0HDP3_9PEZI|nr:non-ribosomal peptide synthetase [Lasiosphaeria hispida]
MRPTPKPAFPRIDASTSWLLLEDEAIEARLLAVIAQVLGIGEGQVQVHNSFRELGGDEEKAAVLRKVCMHAGLDVKVKDILRCPTLAELQSRATPCARQSRPADSLQPVMIAPAQMHKASQMAAKGRHSRTSSEASTISQGGRTEIEQALGAQKSVARIATVRPKAGLLEGRSVALLTLEGTVSAEARPSAVNLIPQTYALFAGTQITALKKAAESILPPESVPDVWIVLDGMPQNDAGDIDMRRLRTWTQNINNDIYQQALSLETQEALQPPTTPMEKSLQRLVSKVLEVPQAQIGVNLSFCQLGGDEMLAMELVARCKHESIFINAAELLESTTLAELAAVAATRGGLAHKWDDDTVDYFELSPMQHLYFQTGMGGDAKRRAGADGSYRFNQSLLLRFKKHFTLEDIAAAMEAVVGHHPMLRSRYSRAASGWVQRILPEVSGSYGLSQTRVSSNQELENVIEITQNSVDVETGPVFAVNYLTTHDGEHLVYLAAHHLAVDLPSWRIIIHDLDELLENGSLLSQRSMPFHKWVDIQKGVIQGQDPKSFLPFVVQPGDYTYWGLQDASNTYSDALEVSFSLSQELTSLLQSSCNQVFKTDCVDIYLAALMLSFAQTFHDRPVPVVWNQEHGRDAWNPGVDISETVGWFTSLCPINQKVEGTDDFINVLRRLKDTRRSIPARGSQYFASRFYNYGNTDLFAQDWPFEIIFSYAGSLQNLERDNGVMEQLAIPGRTLASPTSDIGSNVGRIALFEVSAMIDQGSAKVKFLYSRYSKDQGRISQWVQNYEHLLLEAIGRLRYHPQELTLSDVPHLDVTYDGLAKFNSQRLAELNLATVRDLETIYPVTAVQQSILTSQTKRPDACYLHAIYEFASPNGDPIDVARICTAWQQVTMRHPALRTVFTESVSETGLWDKIILRRASPDMLFIDTAPAEDPVYELSNLPNLRPTDSKPLHRLTVCKAPARTFVKLDISTALCDSSSIHILLHDLRRAYATERAIADLTPFSYPQYLQYLKGVRQEESLGFWRDRLIGTPSCQFPMLSVASEEQRFVNACLDLEITSYELSAFTRTHRTTVDAVLRLAWGLILRCFTGSNKVCFGYQTNGRNDSLDGMRHAVGSFSNTVACKYDLTPYNPLSLMLQAVEKQMAASLPHQHFTMAELQHAMGMKGGERLFNSCLTFTEEPGGLNSKFTTRTSFELKPVSLQQTFDVDVVINTRFSGGKLMVDIGQRVMAPEQALNVASTFGKAIRAILATPNTSVGLVDLFSDRDYAQILAWDAESRQSTGIQAMCVVHELVTKQATIQPNAQAVCSWDGAFTYEQLEEEATNLAHHLVDEGVGPHSVVPVVMDKCRFAPVAMLAVLKSGAAFVPVDALELGMIQPIFERLNSRVVIASEHATSILGNLFDKVITLNEDLMNRIPKGLGPLTSMASPADPACIMFMPTSSSEARGVSFSHAALSTALLGQGPAVKITPLSRVMQLSSFNVDICITEIFTTLVYGGCVCVPSATERLRDFASAVNRMQVNWTYMTPLLSRKVDAAKLPSLKAVCFRTRSLDDDTYNAWHGKVNVILAYGPQDVCPLGISFLEALGTRHLKSIGRPFSGRLLIVNPEDHKKLMPIGAVGELVIEGPTLGCSYPNRESMITPMSPLGVNVGSKNRYLKTGHRARYTEGGLMEFISSKLEDTESESKATNVTEIEQHLRRCLGQGLDVVVDTINFRGTKSESVLVAFVELGDSLFGGEENLTSLSPATREQITMAKQLVQAGLKHIVDPSMIPPIFIPVKHLPVTTSLKGNRRRLGKLLQGLSKEQLLAISTAPKSKENKLQHLKPLPLTQSEQRMRSIWAKVLGVEDAKIGALDTFFGVGGDEVVAAELVTACRHEGFSVPISDVLHNSTLTELCRAMVLIDYPQAVEEPTPTSSVAAPLSPPPMNTTPNTIKDSFIAKVIAPKIGVEAAAIRDAAEATAVQIRFIETGMLRGRSNINYLIFNLTGSIDSKKLEDACMTLATIHPIMRTAFVPYNRRVYQAVIKSANIEFKRHFCATWRLSNMSEKVIRKDQASPIAFCAPMTKFMFLDAGKQSTLIVRLSRAQYDDLSIALFVKDLKRLYDSTENPPRRPTYCDFVRCAHLANSQGAEGYWRTLLEGSIITQVVGHIHPYHISTNMKTTRHLMPIGSLSSLGISFETVLKGAWAMVLASLSASSDVVFGELIDGRHISLSEGQSITGVMGPTINSIPVRVQFPENPLTPLGLLQYVHAQRLAGIPYENLGTLAIVEKCTPWPYWSRLSTVVQHQYEDTAINPFEPKSFHLGSAACKFTVMESKAQDVPDLLVKSIVRGPGNIELSISFCADRVPDAFSEHALRMLCATVSLLTSVSIMQPVIPCGYQYRNMQKRVPLAPSASLTTPTTSSRDIEAVKALSPEHTRTIQTLISNTWTSVLNPRALGVPEGQVHNAAFFDLWGSLIPAAQLTAQLNRELPMLDLGVLDATGLNISMEEVVENPTMLRQFELIATKIKSLVPKEATKGKEKEREKETSDKGAEAKFDAPTLRKKPTINVSASTSAFGSRIRRFASTVTRSGSPPTGRLNTPTLPPSVPAVPAIPATRGIASNMVHHVMSPFSSPKLPDATASSVANADAATAIPKSPSHDAPQLPNIPTFDAITEEDSEVLGAVTLMARDTNSSSAESMTDGSSASSNHSAEEGADQLGPLPLRLPSTPDIRGEEEDLVSPLSATGSPRSSGRFWDSAAPAIARTVSPPTLSPGFKPEMPSWSVVGVKERNNVLGKTGMSPVIGS